ncbi:hypothetical protein K2173_026788 [Erythroxylum novogranatense]|uniref:Uncharacterized protein n=1 Tax=Erythroxylum novogranatense TaxID=1862640 RepID=A0AAV8TX71_9ROSI|nr:hypothetical protein K2173_026788 [Erythroxylum novogranatense]
MTRDALTAQLESLLAIANAAHHQQGSSLFINFEGPTRNTAQTIPREREAPTPAMIENGNPNSAAIGRVISSQADNQHRIIPNAMYDSLYEGAGLAVDPHLRMFSFN